MLKCSQRKEVKDINILIVEDESTVANTLKKIINKIAPEAKIFITSYANEAFKYSKEVDVDLFCLDIQLLDYNGIELARKIRNLSRYTLTPIIFITAIPTRELIAYKETHCYDYIIKPFLEYEFYEKIKKIVDFYKVKRKEDTSQKLKLRFKCGSCIYSLFQKEVIFAESLLRRIHINTENEIYTTNIMTLKKFAEQLSSDFIQCHRSFFVNKSYIKAFDNAEMEILLSNGKKIPCGRRYLMNLKGLGYE